MELDTKILISMKRDFPWRRIWFKNNILAVTASWLKKKNKHQKQKRQVRWNIGKPALQT